MKQLMEMNLILSVWLLVAPFAFGSYTLSPPATWNDVITGMVLAGCSCGASSSTFQDRRSVVRAPWSWASG
jgi:hypothetical protein